MKCSAKSPGSLQTVSMQQTKRWNTKQHNSHTFLSNHFFEWLLLRLFGAFSRWCSTTCSTACSFFSSFTVPMKSWHSFTPLSAVSLTTRRLSTISFPWRKALFVAHCEAGCWTKEESNWSILKNRQLSCPKKWLTSNGTWGTLGNVGLPKPLPWRCWLRSGTSHWSWSNFLRINSFSTSPMWLLNKARGTSSWHKYHKWLPIAFKAALAIIGWTFWCCIKDTNIFTSFCGAVDAHDELIHHGR